MASYFDFRKMFLQRRMATDFSVTAASVYGDSMLLAGIDQVRIYRMDVQNAKLEEKCVRKLSQPVLRAFGAEEGFVLMHSAVSYTQLRAPCFEEEQIVFAQQLTVYDSYRYLFCYGDMVEYRGMRLKTQCPVVDAIHCSFAAKDYVIVATHWIEIYVVENSTLRLFKQCHLDSPCRLARSASGCLFAVGSTDGRVFLFDIRTFKCLAMYALQPMRVEYLDFARAQEDLLICGFNQLHIVRTGFVQGHALQIDEDERMFVHFSYLQHGFLSFVKVYRSAVVFTHFSGSQECHKWIENLTQESNNYIDRSMPAVNGKILQAQYERDFSACLQIIFDRISQALQVSRIAEVKRFFEMYRPIMEYLGGNGFTEEIGQNELYQDYCVKMYYQIPKSTPIDVCTQPTVPDQQRMYLYKFIIDLIEMREKQAVDLKTLTMVQDFIKIASTTVNYQLLLEFMTTCSHFKVVQIHPARFVDFILSCYPHKQSIYIKACLRPLCPSIFQVGYQPCFKHVALLQRAITQSYRDESFYNIFLDTLFVNDQSYLAELASGPQALVAKCLGKATQNDSVNSVIYKYIRSIFFPILAYLQDNSFIVDASHCIADQLRDQIILDQACAVVYMFSLLVTGQVQDLMQFLAKMNDLLKKFQGNIQADEIFSFRAVVESIVSYVVWPAIIRQLSIDTSIFYIEQLIQYFLNMGLLMDNIVPKHAIDECYAIFSDGSAQKQLSDKLLAIQYEILAQKGDFSQYTALYRKYIAGQLYALVFAFRYNKLDQMLAGRMEDIQTALSAE